MNSPSYLDIEAFASRFYRDAAGQPLPLLITPYGYPVLFTAIAPGATQTKTLNIAANADFVLLKINARSVVSGETDTQTVSTQPLPQVRLFITDSGTGENFTNTEVDINNYTSISWLQGLPYPRILSGKSSLQIQARNFGATDTEGTLEVYFDGVQVRAYNR